MISYLDTSALFRLYVDEPGRDTVIAAVAGGEAACTHLIAYAEFHAAMARAERMQRFVAGQARKILERFERDWAVLLVIQVDEALIRRAAVLAGQFGLRGFDSLHLAAAERLTIDLGRSESLFASFDTELNRAAAALGLRTLG